MYLTQVVPENSDQALVLLQLATTIIDSIIIISIFPQVIIKIDLIYVCESTKFNLMS